MKILAALAAAGLFAMPLSAQPADKPTEAPPADGAAASADASKPAATPEPDEAPEGTTPDKPAADPAPDPSR